MKDNKIELKGNIEEIEEYFIKKNNDKNRKEIYNKEEKKRFLKYMVFIIGIVIILYGIYMVYQEIMDNKYYTENECIEKANEYMNKINVPLYERIFMSIIPYIPLLVIGLAIGWILHGVRFNIIG